jgi:ATP-dependent Clp protease protease subunit
MTQHDESQTAGATAAHAPSDALTQLFSKLEIGGQPLNAEQLEFARQIGELVLTTAEGQKLRSRLERDAAETKYYNLQALTIQIGLMQMQEKQKAQARQLAAPWRISLHEEVTSETMAAKQRELMQVSDMWPGRAIDFLLNTPGGSVTDGMMLYDFMLMLRAAPRNHHITVTTLGEAASMGSILLQAADWRVAGPDARILIHAPRGGTIHDLTKLWDLLARRLVARKTCKMTVDQLKKKVEEVTDWWIPADEAKALGFIDDIIVIPDESNSTPPPKVPAHLGADALANAPDAGSNQ